MRLEARERFERLFIPEPNTGCWLWLGSVNAEGYGKFLVEKSRGPELAHRAAVELYTGHRIPQGVLGCHHCDTPACVNPSHIFLGSHADNRRDSIERRENGESQPAIAAALGINQSTVSRICRRERWARA